MAEHNETGKIGEDIAGDFLKSKGYRVLHRNYRKKYGELDIVAKKGVLYYFIEVKSVSWETSRIVSHETWRPEDNVHQNKIKRLLRVIQAYLVSHEIKSDWQFDILVVYVDQEHKKAKVRHLKNLILGS